MPAGTILINQVASLLLPNVGRKMAEVRAGVTLRATPRAIRYAVSALVREGKARRKGNLIFAAADLTVSIHDQVFGPPTGRAPLLECFPDDVDGYTAAKSDLLHHGSHHGGGGAAAEYVLKLAEAA
jgi:hypothetical protein